MMTDHSIIFFSKLYQCLVEEGQLAQQFLYPELDGSYEARRCHHAHIDNAVIQEYLQMWKSTQSDVLKHN